MLNKIIIKLSVITVICGGLAAVLYFTDLGALFKGEIKEKVEEFKEETEEKIEAKKESIGKSTAVKTKLKEKKSDISKKKPLTTKKK